MKKVNLLYPLGLLALPLVSSAQTLGSVLTQIQNLIGQVVPILIGLAVLYFMWGVMKYVAAKDPESQKEARSIMIYGIIVLFVMVSVWGLVNVLASTLDVDVGGSVEGVGGLVPTS